MNKTFQIFLILIIITSSLQNIAADSNATDDDKEKDSQSYVPSEMWKRLKIKIKNDSTILIYAFKADVVEILQEIDNQSKRNKFIFDSTVSGISPEISVKQDSLSDVIDIILKKNDLYKEKISAYSSLTESVFRIKKGPPPKKEQVSPDNLTIEQKLKNKKDKVTLQKTVQELKNNGKKSIPFLVNLMKGDDPYLRRISAVILGEIGIPETVPLLLLALKMDTDKNVKKISLKSLIAMEQYYPRISIELIGIYSSSDDPFTKMLALSGIITTNADEFQNNQILYEATNDESVLVRMKAIELLISKEENRSLINKVYNDLKQTNDPEIKQMAFDVLTKSEDKDAYKTIKEYTVDLNNQVRDSARLALRKLEFNKLKTQTDIHTDIINFLRELLVNEISSNVKYWAAKELVKLGQEGIDALTEIAKNKEKYGQSTSIIAIKTLIRSK